MPAVRILLPGLASLKPHPEVLLGVRVCTCKALNSFHPVFWDSGCGLNCVPRGRVQSSHPLLVHVTLFGDRVFAVVRIRVGLLRKGENSHGVRPRGRGWGDGSTSPGSPGVAKDLWSHQRLGTQGLPQNLREDPAPLMLGLDFWPPERGESALLLLKPPVYGHL